ncbi:MAG: hypothetical protein Tsb007_35380 [Rhizobacter sp.]
MSASDLRVTVDQPKLRCVLDPSLALGHAAGPRLAQRLTRVFETWLTRSFWQLIDASELLRQTGPDPTALSEWVLLRDRTDAGSWLLRWVGDNLAESQLQAAPGDDLVERFEWLAAALAARQDTVPASDWQRGFDPVAGALDALVLSAALDGALILSERPPSATDPWPVQALQRLRLPVEQTRDDSAGLFVAERQVVRQALAAAGLAPLLQPLPPLAVVHVLVAPRAAADTASADEEPDPWAQAHAWWYLV